LRSAAKAIARARHEGTYKAVNDKSADANNFNLNSHVTTNERKDAVKARDSTDLQQASKDDARYGVQTDGAVKNAGPVVLDMNGNGKLDFIALGEGGVDNVNNGLESGVSFDIDGDGTKETVAWVGAEAGVADGILFYDKDNNLNTVTASEMVFSDSAGETDMQGLARKYDGNQDKTLSGTELNGFYVWQDHNGNGTVDAGEVKSAAAAGITAIGVDTSHTNGATTSKGNKIYRTNTFTRNGVAATVGDVAFNYVKVVDTAGWWQFKDQFGNYDNVFLGVGIASIIDLGAADDAVIAVSAYNQIASGDGNDFALALGLANHIKTGNGDDLVLAGGIGNYISLGAGNDIALVSGLGNWIDTGSGNDVVVALGALGTGAGANIVRKEGDGNLVAILGATANVIYNKGKGKVSCLMIGVANLLHKDGSGDVSMVVGGMLNSISQKNSAKDDRYLAIMFGSLNVSTHIGEGDYYAVMFGTYNVSTNVVQSAAAKEVVIMTGAVNVHTTVGAAGRSMYFMFGVGNVLTKTWPSSSRATGPTGAASSNTATPVPAPAWR
jgi:hypothetical protein